MKKVLLTAFLCLFSCLIFASQTPGITAFLLSDYSNAANLLKKERSALPPHAMEEYKNISLYLIESLLFAGNIPAAEKELNTLKSKLTPSELKGFFRLFEAETCYFKSDFQGALDILNTPGLLKSLDYIKQQKGRLFQASALAELGKTQEALKVLEEQEPINLDSVNPEALALQKKIQFEKIKLLIMADKLDDAKALLKKNETAEFNSLRLWLGALELKYEDYRKLQKNLSPDVKVDDILYRAEKAAYGKLKAANSKEGVKETLEIMILAAKDKASEELALREFIDYDIKSGDKIGAVNGISRLLRLLPDLPERNDYIKLQFSLAQAADIKLAYELFLKYFNDKKNDSVIRCMAGDKLGEIYRQQKNFKAEQGVYDFIMLNGDAEQQQKAALKLAEHYFNSKQYEEALAFLEKIQDTSRFVYEKVLLSAKCRIEQEKYEEALQLLDLIITAKIEELLPETYFIRGNLYSRMNNGARALEDYELLSKLENQNSPFVRESFLKMADYYLNSKSYLKAALQYQNFAEKYPTLNGADNARYKAVYFFSLSGSSEEMRYNCGKLKELYPDSPLLLRAMFHEVDYFKSQNQMNQALNRLEDIAKLNQDKDLEISAQIYYDRALCYKAMNRALPAILELDKLIEKYPSSSRFADSCFLAGSIAFDSGENLRAKNFFTQALKARPEKNFTNVCKGRIADCYFMLFSKSEESEYLDTAIKLYQELANDLSNDIFIRSQSLFKLGKCYEKQDSDSGNQDALFAYNDVIYKALNGENVPPVWINKSAKNAINIHLRNGGSNALDEAMQIVNNLKLLKSLNAEEIQMLENDVKERYK